MDGDTPKSYTGEDSPYRPRIIDFDLEAESLNGDILFSQQVAILPDTPEVKAHRGAYYENGQML